jgi:hypothetical protein
LAWRDGVTRPGGWPDAKLRSLLSEGDPRRAVRVAIRLYGAELFGFLAAVLMNEREAIAVYANAWRRVEQEISAFAWRWPVRIWVYALARRELARLRPSGPRAPTEAPDETISRRPIRHQNITATLREALDPADRELLILRLDRHLAWRELAATALGCDAPAADVLRESGRLRARMDALREELSLAAREMGHEVRP